MNPFVDSESKLRNGWWILIFFVLLAAQLVPAVWFWQQTHAAVPIALQALMVVLACVVCQWLRGKPQSELFGEFTMRWPKELLQGCAIGAMLMLLPALFLWAIGCVAWRWNDVSLAHFGAAISLFISVAIAEELLFRGFVFQRLIAGVGVWAAQLLLAAYFVLTHAQGLSTAGNLKLLAGVNIFCASIMFGLAFLRTRSLAMPLGLHFAANLMQGSILGFGVSGNDQYGLFSPTLSGPNWLTGSAFGIEASVPGMLAILAAIWLLKRSKPTSIIS